jgi:LuxR family transcriptional regulator, maltose regulon positive regulatory protein
VGKFVHHVEKAAAELEAVQRWNEAIAWYLRGLDADSLNEAFYQGLMRCYAGLGNRAEALSIYRRLRQQLSVVLGLQPSNSSETLARELRLQ